MFDSRVQIWRSDVRVDDCRVLDGRFPMLMMAPEGTCSDNLCILQFRTGAFVPGVPVLPVLLKYRCRHHNPSWIIINVGWQFVSPSASAPPPLSPPWRPLIVYKICRATALLVHQSALTV